jgi:pimeloyl-ACP methyl ester carboxylesterase
MTCFVLIPGAGGDAATWSRLVPELERRGHTALPVDIAEDDPALGLPEYAGTVLAAIEAATIENPADVVLVATSLGAFTAPVVATRVPVRAVVLINAMVPLPGETPGQWFDAVGAGEARAAADAQAGRAGGFSVETHFFNALPDDVLAWVRSTPGREPAPTPFGQPCEFERWPDVPIHVVAGRDDRFFPLELQRRVARERLGLDVDEIAGGHLLALGNPGELADLLASYLA